MPTEKFPSIHTGWQIASPFKPLQATFRNVSYHGVHKAPELVVFHVEGRGFCNKRKVGACRKHEDTISGAHQERKASLIYSSLCLKSTDLSVSNPDLWYPRNQQDSHTHPWRTSLQWSGHFSTGLTLCVLL